MTQRGAVLRLILLTGPIGAMGASGCQYDHDVVLPGDYAQEGAKAMTVGSAMSGAQQLPPSSQTQGSSNAGGNSMYVGGQAGTGQSTMGQSTMGQSTTGQTTSPNTGDTSASAGSSATNGSTAEPGSGGAAGATAVATDDTSQTGGDNQAPTEPAGPCDLTGRWLVVSRLTTDALGALQFAHYLEYFEIEQQGDAFTVTRGFMCQADAVGDGSLAANVDFTAANASLPAKVRYDGRAGTSTEAGGGCQVEVENWYTVRGVTTPYYLDPNNPLPTGEQPATDTTPGWEDWDGDGNPGITGILTGVVSGKIFVGPRLWTAMSGMVADTAKFRLSVKWGQQQNILGYDGSALLATEAAIGPDPASHFTEFYRLAPDQATGDDLATCNEVIQLAPQLLPEAASG